MPQPTLQTTLYCLRCRSLRPHWRRWWPDLDWHYVCAACESRVDAYLAPRGWLLMPPLATWGYWRLGKLGQKPYVIACKTLSEVAEVIDSIEGVNQWKTNF